MSEKDVNNIVTRRQMKYVPNAVTIVRILLTPVFLFFLLHGSTEGRIAALGIFVFAAISDWLDGKIARMFKVKSRLGQFLDPFADKILVLGTFITLPFLLPTVVPWWAVILIALRDVLITGLRMVAERRNRPIPTMQSARLKTLFQLSFLILVLLLLVGVRMPGTVAEYSEIILYGPFIYGLLMVTVVFTVSTGVIYLWKWSRTTPLNTYN